LPPTLPELASNIEGAVDRDTVIGVLKNNGVSVSKQEGGEEGMLVLAKADYFETRRIPLIVRKTLLRRLERKFGIPLARFYNPNMIQ
jgi:hypothetical protein